MSDLFHEHIPDEYIVKVCQVMAAANWHTYQVLTKRADRMSNLLRSKLKFASKLNQIWWGVSVEDKKYGIPRIEKLQTSKAGTKFLSIEPLLEDLGKLDLRGIDWLIVGGESGPGARPVKKEWVTSIRDQCRRTGTPFFFKQWGGVQKSKTGRRLDGRIHDDIPPTTEVPLPSFAERRTLLDTYLTKFAR